MITIDSKISEPDDMIDSLHDLFYDFDEIHHDTARKEFQMLLGYKKILKNKISHTKKMVIVGAESYCFEDPEQIGENSVNEISLVGNRLLFECNIPGALSIELANKYEIVISSL